MSPALTRRATLYPATRHRPEGYPPDLPFVADRDVDVDVARDPTDRDWPGARWLASDPDALFSLLVSSSVLDGWRVRGRDTPTSPLMCADCLLERDDRVRGITITRIDSLAFVTLRDTPAGPDATTA